MNRLHIYAQEWEHQKAYIVGSEDALNSLRDAIHTALREHTSESRVIFAADGEGYRVHFIALEDGQQWNRLALPYTDETARDTRENTIKPWELVATKSAGIEENNDKPRDVHKD